MASRKYPYSKVTKVARSFSSHNLQRTCGLSLTKTTRQRFADHPDGAKELGRRGFSTGGGLRMVELSGYLRIKRMKPCFLKCWHFEDTFYKYDVS